jgi:hypothetical protein
VKQLPKSVGAGNPHATFCGNRGRATASGDPVINELPERESDEMLNYLFAHQLQPQFRYTNVWAALHKKCGKSTPFLCNP